MRKLICLIAALICLPMTAMAASISGQPYTTFAANYEANVTFINTNTNRHLLPMTISSSKSEDGDGRMYHRIFGDVLSLEVRTDPTGQIIEMCQIVMIAPSGMELGNAAYNDFAISGYHSYALLMAMDSSADPAQRYQLVTQVEEGLRQTAGSYSTQIGVYALTCTSANSTVTITFDNTLAAPKSDEPVGDAGEGGGTGEAPAEETAPQQDEGAGLG